MKVLYYVPIKFRYYYTPPTWVDKNDGSSALSKVRKVLVLFIVSGIYMVVATHSIKNSLKNTSIVYAEVFLESKTMVIELIC